MMRGEPLEVPTKAFGWLNIRQRAELRGYVAVVFRRATGFTSMFFLGLNVRSPSSYRPQLSRRL